MVFEFIKKKLGGGGDGNAASGGDNSAAGEPVEQFKPDTRKAASWFRHAHNAADTRNNEYAIECFVTGLKFDPDNLGEMEALREVSLRRKLSGGKPMSRIDVMKGSGKQPIDKYVHALKQWCLAPLDVDLVVGVMETALALIPLTPDLHMVEVVHWVAATFLEKGEIDKKKEPTKKTYLRACELLEAARDYPLAITACQFALQKSPDDNILVQKLKDLEAERSIQSSNLGESGKEEGGFRGSVRDMDKQKLLEDQDSLTKSQSAIDNLIAKYRTDLEAKPDDHATISRLVDALKQKGDDGADQEALKVLREALETTGQYRYKVLAGDIVMKQMNRHLRDLKNRLDAAPNDDEIKHRFQDLARQKLQFELEEFTDRAKNYPTDMPVRFELGKRLWMVKKYDEAIAAFQEAQADAKVRVASMQYLGMCYLAKGWFDEAVATLRKAIEIHPYTDDRMALDVRYLLMDALENSARKNTNLEQAREAQQIASQIVQTSITYRDIRDRLDKLRKLVEELAQPKA